MPVRPLARPLARPLSAPGAGYRPVLGGGGQLTAAWAFQDSALDLDFQGNTAAINAYPAGTATSQLTVTRAGNTGWVQSLAGIWSLVNANLARQSDKGLLVEEARTNNLLQNRDMTNVAWVKGATITVAQTQIGIDGTANSATLVTGGAVQATNTVLQTITLGSAADTYSVWLKRVTGSGTVEISADGSTWTGVTLTTSYQQFQVQQTLANPVCGIRIATNGDQVAADFSQLETGAFATSPIQTAGATVTRNADVPQVTNAAALLVIQTSASAFFQTFGVGNGGNLQRFLGLGATDVIGTSTATVVNVTADNSNFAPATIGGAGTMSGTVKSAFGMDNTSVTAVANGGTKATQATSAWATNAVGGAAYLGNASAGTRALNGYLQRAVFALPKGIFDSRTSP